MAVKFYEVVYEYGYTIPIKGTRRPTVQEAAAFCKLSSAGAVTAVYEISEEYLYANYNCDDVDNWPVFDRPKPRNDELLAVAVVDPANGTAAFVDELSGFEPLTEMHNAAENWVKMVNSVSSRFGDSSRAVIVNFNHKALQLALSYAMAYLGDSPTTTVLL